MFEHGNNCSMAGYSLVFSKPGPFPGATYKTLNNEYKQQ